MALSRDARELAALIQYHDWSDAPYRFDRALHRRDEDTHCGSDFLDAEETVSVVLNVTAIGNQFLLYRDPNHNPWEFALACGISPRPHVFNSNGQPSGIISPAGLMWRHDRLWMPWDPS
jgi:hypothetical protein